MAGRRNQPDGDVAVRLAGLYGAMTATFNGPGAAPVDILADAADLREWAEAVGVPYLVAQMLRNPEYVSPDDLAEWMEWPHRDVWLTIMAKGTELWEGMSRERATAKAG